MTKRKIDPFQQEFIHLLPLLDEDIIVNTLESSEDWEKQIIPYQKNTAMYPRDPVEFMTRTLGFQMWSKLEEICRSVQNNKYTVVESGFGVGKCQPYNSDVYLADGDIVKAESLIDSMFFIAGFDKSDWSIRPMLAVAEDNGIKHCYRVTLADGTVVTRTKNHPLLTWGGWKPIERLRVGEKIAVPTSMPFFGEHQASDDEIKMLAYLLSEGSTKYYVALSQKDGAVSDDMISTIQKLGCVARKDKSFGIHPSGQPGTRGKRIKNNITMLAERWGMIGKSSYTKEIPSFVFRLPKDQLALFVRTLYSGDGWVCVGADNRIEIGYCSSSENIARGLATILLKFGIRAKVRSKISSKYKSISYSVDLHGAVNALSFFSSIGIILGKEDQCNKVISVAEKLSPSAQRGMFDIVPKSAWDTIMTAYAHTGHGYHGQPNNNVHQNPSRIVIRDVEKYFGVRLFNGWASSNIGWCNIVSIEDAGELPTVAISVPETKAYATNVIDHNSVVASALACWFMATYEPAIVVTLAPTHQQVQNIMWRYMRAVGRRANLPGRIFETPRWEVNSDHYAIGLSPRKATQEDMATIQGIHGPRELVIMDEGAGLPRTVFEAVNGLIVSDECRLLCIGNPIEQSGPFWDACNSPNWNHIRISCLDHPNVIEGRETIPGAVTRSWIDERCNDWATEVPEGTAESVFIPWQNKYYKPLPIFYAKVLGIAPEQAEDQLIKLSWVIDAQERVIAERDVDTIIGLDPAPRGGDDNALCIRQGNRVSQIKRKKGQDTQEIARWLSMEISEQNAVMSYIDDVGSGTGVVDKGREMGLPIVAVNFSRNAVQRKRFANMRAECYWRVRELLREGKMQLPDDPLLLGDLTAPKYFPDMQGRIQIESKDDIRGRIGRSPDSGDSLALTYVIPGAVPGEDYEDSGEDRVDPTYNASRWSAVETSFSTPAAKWSSARWSIDGQARRKRGL